MGTSEDSLFLGSFIQNIHSEHTAPSMYKALYWEAGKTHTSPGLQLLIGDRNLNVTYLLSILNPGGVISHEMVKSLLLSMPYPCFLSYSLMDMYEFSEKSYSSLPL